MRRAPWGKAGALALTVLAHLISLLCAGRQGSAPQALPQPAPAALMVLLLPEPAAAPAEPPRVIEPVLPQPAAASPEPEPAPAAEPAAVPEQAGTPPEFFPVQELSSPPKVASGLVRGELLELSDTSGGYVTVRFWINALGEVVRAKVVDVDGNEDDEERLLAALQQVRFLPARLGHAAVNSELQIELRVVSQAGL